MSEPLKKLIDKVQNFPRASGVYLMKDAKSHIIYVGKAKDLRQRVRQYFTEQDSRYQVKFLMERVRDVDFLQTPTESEALLLENSLIKKHKPKYNIFLKDDKSYLGLKLAIKDDFPRLIETRKIKKDGSLYYGPFTSAESLRDVKEFIDRFFLLRTCGDHEFSNRSRPCLEYQIKRCSAPCVAYVSHEDYAEQIRSVKLFLEGKSRELQKIVTRRMETAAADLNFEEAARLRDLLRNMDFVLEKQNVTQLTFDFMDVLALERSENKIGIGVLMIREGHLIDSKYFVLKGMESDDEVLQNFATQYYSENAFIPREIVVPVSLTDSDALSETLSTRAGFHVTIRAAKKGERRDLMAIAKQNLVSHFERDRVHETNLNEVLDRLAQKLDLPSPPRRIECFDVSHISGAHAVGSQVCLMDGVPFKNGYRRYKIRLQGPPDDYATMREILSRRFAPDSKDSSRPDLILVDGGKGQLNVAVKILAELNVTGVQAAGIAKGSGPGARAKGQWADKKEDEVYLLGRKNPVLLRIGSPELMLLQRIRDEAHRFAITYHRSLREKEMTRSWLDDVPGLGAQTKIKLLQRFGSPEKIRDADEIELRQVSGLKNSLVNKLLTGRRKL